LVVMFFGSYRYHVVRRLRKRVAMTSATFKREIARARPGQDLARLLRAWLSSVRDKLSHSKT
jgi:hypothetical protein